jgi:hypothetical protein
MNTFLKKDKPRRLNYVEEERRNKVFSILENTILVTT